MAAGTQRLGLVILGPILAAGRRAAWTERPCERSSASRFWVSRIWVSRAAPVETNAAYGGRRRLRPIDSTLATPSGVRRSPCRCAEATPHPE
ncbi:MAG: hypothetical protein EHJ95_08050 [Methanobacteriota archaeon]|nr:MAG: hypothetical protein EHJ95_08050 [Euryarchaeota archaeon]